MTIQIIKVSSYTISPTNETFRSAEFVISDGGGEVYFYSRGGLPTAGSVQTILDAMEAELWNEASANGQVATAEQVEQAAARAWFIANGPAITAIFGGTVTQLDSGLGTLITAMFPSATANQRTQMRYALMAGLLTCRCYANGEGLL